MITLSEQKFAKLSEKLGHELLQRKLKLATAESCTGGWVAQVITMIPGSSNWFDRGFVTYSNQAKQEMLAVSADTLEQFGAVSEQTAIEMAQGAIKYSQAHVSIAITGIAGPDGGSDEKPVGLVWLAWSLPNQEIITEKSLFSGDRQQIRAQAVEFSLMTLLSRMQ